MSENFVGREQAEKDVLACAAFLAENIKSGDGRAEAMKVIVPQYLAAGNVDLAAELANTVDDPFSRDRLLIEVAEKCAEIDDVDYALQLADAIDDEGLCAQARERIALKTVVAGDQDKAREIASEMMHPDFVQAGIAVRQAADGDEHSAFGTIEEIDFPSARVLALQNIASAHIEAGENDQALTSLERAVQSANEIEHNEEKIRSLCDIANLYIEAQRNDLAAATYEVARIQTELLDNTHRDFFLGNCALGFLHADNLELAESTLDLIADKTQMSSALLGFAREYWKRDEKGEALETLEESYAIIKSQREKETRDSRSRNALMGSIATQFAGFGKTERSIEIAQENQDIDETMSALSQIGQILAVQHEDGLARQAINAIPEDSNRLLALIALSDTKGRQEETEDAIILLDEASELAETVPQPAARSTILNEIAARYIDFDLPEKARSVSLQNLQVIAGIRDESSLAAALAVASQIYEKSGMEISETEMTVLKSLVGKVA